MENQTDKKAHPDADKVVTKKSRQSSWANIGILITAFGTIVLVIAFYCGYYALVNSHNHIVQLTLELNNKIIKNQQAVSALQKSRADLEQLSEQLQISLTNQKTRIEELSGTQQNKKGMNLSEAQYLVGLANDNLQIGDNIPLVITLLQAADQKLRDLSDPNLTPLRKALAADTAALKSVTPVDVTGIYLQLSALNEQVDKLPLPNNRPSENQATEPLDNKKLTWWRRGLQESLGALRQIVVIRYNKPGVRPFIPPDQQAFLYQNIHATLEQALSAVVHRQPEIYRASLATAAAWIKEYFLADSAITQSLLSSLTQLQTVVLHPPLPTISASLQAFRDYNAKSEQTEKSTVTSAKP
jgi:uroporphyrin-3 C-methyltransferase